MEETTLQAISTNKTKSKKEGSLERCSENRRPNRKQREEEKKNKNEEKKFETKQNTRPRSHSEIQKLNKQGKKRVTKRLNVKQNINEITKTRILCEPTRKWNKCVRKFRGLNAKGCQLKHFLKVKYQ